MVADLRRSKARIDPDEEHAHGTTNVVTERGSN
jgi:hypothetical protein